MSAVRRHRGNFMSMADQAADNISYFSKEVLWRINGFRATPKKKRRISFLKERLEDLAYWSKYLIPLLHDLTEKKGDALPEVRRKNRRSGHESKSQTLERERAVCKTPARLSIGKVYAQVHNDRARRTGRGMGRKKKVIRDLADRRSA